MTTPTFLVIGAQKSATSSLCASLAEHPDVFVCHPKEPHFFSNDEVYARGWAWYSSLFDGAETASAVGEGSTSYTMHARRPNAVARIARHLPDARLVYIVRHPLERIESAWRHLHLTGRTRAPIGEVLRERPQLVDTSLYWAQIERYLEHFPRERILTLLFEEYRRDQEAVLTRCREFLGVAPPPATVHGAVVRNVSADRRTPSRPLRLLHRVPGLTALGRLLPRSAQRGVRELLGGRRVGAPVWDAENRARVVEAVRGDSETFLRFAGRPVSTWSLDGEALPDRTNSGPGSGSGSGSGSEH